MICDSMDALLSVIICTHDPRRDYLERALAALKAQTLSSSQWELIVVDNASKESVADRFDIRWHPQGRHVQEDRLGLTAARLRGISESLAEIVVFVDDDNVLAPDYLERVLEIADARPHLGAWSGQLIAEFDEPPPEWTKPYQRSLGIRPVLQEEVLLLPADSGNLPWGAGMCVRRKVGMHYAHLCSQPLRRALGRIGDNLAANEDLDLALTSYDLGLATGLFPQLLLRHLMPPFRLTQQYFARLAEGLGYSDALLAYIRQGVAPRWTPWISEVRERIRERNVPRPKQIWQRANRAGIRRAHRVIERLG